MIDICEFAVGLSRQLYGKTIASERPGHRLMETWHPLGVVGVITAFNFPVAVWSWNTAIALVCGDTVVWKPSELTPLTALACQALIERAADDVGAPRDGQPARPGRPRGRRAAGRRPAGGAAERDRVGADGPARSARGWRSGSAGRCSSSAATTPRSSRRRPTSTWPCAASCSPRRAPRPALHDAAPADRALARSPTSCVERIVAAYRQLPIGDPSAEGTLVGPLIHETAYRDMVGALEQARADGGEVFGGERHDVGDESAYYVAPAVVRMPAQTEVVHNETFAPILYVLTYDDLDEAIALHNAVPQGLSSSIFTLDMREAERFMAADGSDCGIANVNIGTSGAEIGGAFGGEKETGGGRESGSDAWKAYMRRATNTVNYSSRAAAGPGRALRLTP